MFQDLPFFIVNVKIKCYEISDFAIIGKLKCYRKRNCNLTQTSK